MKKLAIFMAGAVFAILLTNHQKLNPPDTRLEQTKVRIWSSLQADRG